MYYDKKYYAMDKCKKDPELYEWAIQMGYTETELQNEDMLDEIVEDYYIETHEGEDDWFMCNNCQTNEKNKKDHKKEIETLENKIEELHNKIDKQRLQINKLKVLLMHTKTNKEVLKI